MGIKGLENALTHANAHGQPSVQKALDRKVAKGGAPVSEPTPPVAEPTTPTTGEALPDGVGDTVNTVA